MPNDSESQYKHLYSLCLGSLFNKLYLNYVKIHILRDFMVFMNLSMQWLID